jgi:hypothetical protein
MTSQDDDPGVPIQKKPDSINPQNRPTDSGNSGDDKYTGITEGKPLHETADNPAPPKPQPKSKRKCREYREWWKFGFEVATFVAVVAYVVVNARMYGEMVTSNNATKAAADAATKSAQAAKESIGLAREEQRPYVWLEENGHGTPEFVPNPTVPGWGQIIWTWSITNYGRTPAYDLYRKEFMKVGNAPFRPGFHLRKLKVITVPLPPTATGYNTIVSAPVSADNFRQLMNIDGGIRIKAIVVCRNGAHSYETGICLQHLRTGASMYCEGNYMK